MTSKWADSLTWNVDWEKSRDLGKGGHGTAIQVRRKSDGMEACIKYLNAQGNPERRARLAKEAMAYDTIEHSQVPRLIQSNAHNHKNSEYKLFIATELVPGPTMEEFILGGGRFDPPEAIDYTESLLGIIKHFHGQGIVHRDIKPDNIILRNGTKTDPVLLDFGLNHKADPTDSLETARNEELGNRFIRLPELSIGSQSKRDPRSDLAFAGAVMLYALTGIIPGTISDDQERMPHQRDEFRNELAQVPTVLLLPLYGFFDRCFSSLEKRFDNAEVMLSALFQLKERLTSKISDDDEADRAVVLGHARSGAVKERQDALNACHRARERIAAVISEVTADSNGYYVSQQTGMHVYADGLHDTYGLTVQGEGHKQFMPRWHIQCLGSEIVVNVEQPPFSYRLPITHSNQAGDFETHVRKYLFKGMRRILEETAREPPAS